MKNQCSKYSLKMEITEIFQKDVKDEYIPKGWKMWIHSKRMEKMNILKKDGKHEYIPKGWKIKLKLKTSYKMKNLGVLGHLTKRFQLLGLPTHLSGRRQTTYYYFLYFYFYYYYYYYYYFLCWDDFETLYLVISYRLGWACCIDIVSSSVWRQ